MQLAEILAEATIDDAVMRVTVLSGTPRSLQVAPAISARLLEHQRRRVGASYP